MRSVLTWQSTLFRQSMNGQGWLHYYSHRTQDEVVRSWRYVVKRKKKEEQGVRQLENLSTLDGSSGATTSGWPRSTLLTVKRWRRKYPYCRQWKKKIHFWYSFRNLVQFSGVLTMWVNDNKAVSCCCCCCCCCFSPVEQVPDIWRLIFGIFFYFQKVCNNWKIMHTFGTQTVHWL